MGTGEVSNRETGRRRKLVEVFVEADTITDALNSPHRNILQVDTVAIPDFQSFMLPFLDLTKDGEEHSVAELRVPLAERFNLSETEQQELLPSGQQSRFNNRVAWAKVYLERAALLAKTRRGHFRITDRGRDVLANPPARIDIAFLSQFPGFIKFRQVSQEEAVVTAEEISEKETPQEALETAFKKIRDDLAVELLEQVKSASPRFFERIVVDLMLKMGYGGYSGDAGSLSPPGADEGIDGVIHEDRLGLDTLYLQAKKWENPVGRPEIQKFVGALHGKRAKKGVFITTSVFTQDALNYVAAIDPKVVLIDGQRLAQFMIDFDLGVSRIHTYEIKRIDSDYFAEE